MASTFEGGAGGTGRWHGRGITSGILGPRVIDLPIEPRIRDVPYWGPMGIARHAALARRGLYLRVYVDGADVTDRCRFFDDTPGRSFAWLYRLTADGRYILRAGLGGPAREIVSAFQVREGPAFPWRGEGAGVCTS